MKRNLFLRLCLVMIAWLSLHSCRQDIVPEKEIYNNTSAFQLTSKSISLSESKHKAKLFYEIEKAETELKKLKTNAHGKTVNYSNGSIDTESVIYIENGPNYHTYTFNLKNENAPADAPLENLLLTPLPDGTYKKLLISYNFTMQEKQIISSGGYVNTKGKSTITDLGNGALSDIVSKSQSCGYVEAQAYTICSEYVHYNGESDCDADVKSHLITVYLWKCESLDDGSGTSGGGPSPGSGPGGGGEPCPDCPTDGGTTPTEPCNGNGVLTGPLDPTTDIGDGTTCTGVPTQPNLPVKNTPCAKIKANFENIKFKEKYDKLTKTSPSNENVFDLNHELAVYMRFPTVGTTIPPAYVDVDLPDCATDGNLPSFEEGMGGLMHTHNNESCNGGTPIKAPSPTDIQTFINILMREAMQYTGSYTNAYSLVTTSGGNYMLMYSGTNYPGAIKYDEWEKLQADYEKTFQRFYDKNENVTQADIERIFTKFMQEKINKPGLDVYRVTPNSKVKIEYDPNSTNSVKQTPCP